MLSVLIATATLSPANSALPCPTTAGLVAFGSTMQTSPNDFELFVMNTDGSNLRRLTFRDQDDRNPALSPDGMRVAWHSHRDGRNIHVMNLDGTNEQDLTLGGTAEYTRPWWSPDGQHIAYCSDTEGNSNIYIMDSDGSNKHQITFLPQFFNEHPTYSPDGSKIAFETTRDVNWEVYVMNADGTNPMNLSNNPASDAEPRYSPDGKSIVFNSSRTGNGYDIYIMNADGTNQRIIYGSPARDWFGCFTADGTKIIFTSDQTGVFQIYSMNLDGSNVTQLTNGATDSDTPSCSQFGLLVRPTAFLLVRGSVVSGGLSDLIFQDDLRLVLRPGVVISSVEAPIHLETRTNTSMNNPSTIHFRIEASANVANIGYTIEFFNYVSNSYEQVLAGASNQQDESVDANVTSNATRFISPANGEMKARTKWKSTGPVLSYPWNARVDFIGWYLSP